MLNADAIADIEGDAGHLLSLAGYDGDDVPTIGRLCRALLGTPPEMVVMRGEAELAIVLGAPRVFVRRGTSAERARWLACHEIAEWWYATRGYTGDDVEARCDALGAALAVPRRALLRALREVGRAPKALASKLGTTQSLAFLRVHEVTLEPGVLVREAGAIVRGGAFVWGALDVARAKRLRRAGVRRARITDEPSRVGLSADVADAA